MNAQELKNIFKHEVDSFISGELFHKGVIVGVLKKHCRSDGDYRLVLKALSGKTSSKELTEAEWIALAKFVQAYKPDGGKWQSQLGEETLKSYCNTLVNSMVDTPEQTRFA